MKLEKTLEPMFRQTIEELNSQPTGTVHYYLSERFGLEITGTASTWHHLNRTLELDALCEHFNALEVNNWDSNAAYGLSTEGEAYLKSVGAEIKESWNTYNWSNNFDVVMQGSMVDIDGEPYVLLQCHHGGDVRGNYSDAKLFKLSLYMEDYFLYSDEVYGEYFEGLEDGFDVTSGEGAVLQSSGNDITDEMKALIIEKHGLSSKNNSLTLDAVASQF